MVPARTSQVLSALECPVCRGSDMDWSSGPLTCRGCARQFQTIDGYLNLHPGDPEPVTPIQRLMQFPPAVAVYEGVWRPLGYFLASNRSFPKDLERITSLIQRRRGLILDLACGPGNVTRQIARLAPNSTVIGFDLSPQMLARAVRLTAKERLDNVFYIRGSALAMPFSAEAFGAVTCFGALQLFTDQEQAVGEIARVLGPDGEFVCQTTVFSEQPPWIVRLGNRLLKFGCFSLHDLRARLGRFNFDLTAEEQSSITYIFRAAKAAE
jgi:SAM-dependent methyltransferase